MAKSKMPVLRGYVSGRLTKDDDQIAVWCPFCADWHYHGWGHNRKPGTREHRCAHCHVEHSPFLEGGYDIALFPKTVIRQIKAGAGQ